MNYEKKKKFIVNIAFYAVLAAICFLAVKYTFKWMLPFVIAFVVAAIINPIANKISTNFKINKKLAAVFSGFLFYSIAVALVALIASGLYMPLRNLFSDLPNIYENNIAPTFISVTSSMQYFLANIDPALSDTLLEVTSGFAENAGSFVSNISVKAISWLSSFITKIPMLFISTLFCVIATFFIALDYEKIMAFILRQIPERWHLLLIDIKNHGIDTVCKYLKSYMLIMCITFCELSIAFWLLKIENFVIIALIIAVFDVFPVCGSGGILVPWAVFSLIQGRFALGIGIFIVYAIITIIRQVIEPKIVGTQVGLPPVVTLMAMFLGAQFFGVIGLFGFPITLVILKNLNDSGRIKLFK